MLILDIQILKSPQRWIWGSWDGLHRGVFAPQMIPKALNFFNFAFAYGKRNLELFGIGRTHVRQ